MVEDDDDQLYDVARVAEWIRANAFERIAMQIPDDMLKNAANICANETGVGRRANHRRANAMMPPTRRRRRRKEKDVFVLADTTFGSCWWTKSRRCIATRTVSHVGFVLLSE